MLPFNGIGKTTGFKSNILIHDLIIITFTMILSIFTVIGWQRVDHPGALLSINILMLILTLIFIYLDDGKRRNPFHWAHHWFPVFTLLVFYIESSLLDGIFFSRTFDSLLLGWDFKLFGFSPSYWFSTIINNVWVDEIFFLLYTSYYILLFLPGIFIFLRDENKLDEINLALIIMMYVHFLFFIFFPADGPVSQSFQLFQQGKFFIPLVHLAYQVGEKGGGAFPSTHVAVAVLMFLYLKHEFPRWTPFLAFLALGITLATVYCSFHYAVDSLAGIGTGSLFYLLNRKLSQKWLNKRQNFFISRI